MRRAVWDTDMLGALVADERGTGKTVTSVAAAMICKLVTDIVLIGLPLSILCGSTLKEWVNLAQSDFQGNIGHEQE
jgi:hypothetical protein